MKVREAIEEILMKNGVEIPPERTCDHLIVGDQEAEVTGVVSTFMVTLEVLRETVKLGANLIVTHEPTLFFEFKGGDPFEESNPVYQEKQRLISEYGINIWRFHDHMHAENKDGIYRGLEKEIGWEQYVMKDDDPEKPFYHFGACYEIPETTLQGLADFFKEKLDMQMVRVVGTPDMPIKRVSILVGGGSQGLGDPLNPIKIMEAKDIDVIVCGEIMELLTAPYIHEMQLLGYNRSMLILGHERSEEAGMKHLVEWLEPILPGLPVHFLDAKEPFCYL